MQFSRPARLPKGEFLRAEAKWFRETAKAHHLWCGCGDYLVHFEKRLKQAKRWPSSGGSAEEGGSPGGGERGDGGGLGAAATVVGTGEDGGTTGGIVTVVDTKGHIVGDAIVG